MPAPHSQSKDSRKGGKDFNDKPVRNLQETLGERYPEILRPKTPEYIADFVNRVKDYAKTSISKVSNSQLRNIYSRVLNCRSVMDIQLLRPKLAYVGGKIESTNAFKETKKQTQSLVDDLERVAQEVKKEEQVKHFKEFMEMLVAYHKQYGKND